jgi:riboflavin transporter FmnP
MATPLYSSGFVPLKGMVIIMQINKKTRYVVFTAMFAAISSVLMFFEFPLPFLPPFLKLDLSDVPVLVGAFIFGPIPAVAITLIKDIIHLSVTQSGGVGELADFLITSTLALTAGLIYKAWNNKLASVIGSASGILLMTVVAVFSNIYILLPLYMKQGSFDVKSYIIYGVVPFNIIKGLFVTIITLLVYKRLKLILFKNKKT